MESLEPIMGLTRSPPTMAVMMPAKGGNPLAMEMPRHSGSAIKKTRKPEVRSWVACALRPLRPSFGT
jgi:hypothetical protein